MLEWEVGIFVTFYELHAVLEECQSWNHELDVGCLSYSTQRKTKLLHCITWHLLRFRKRIHMKKRISKHGHFLPVSEWLYTAECCICDYGFVTIVLLVKIKKVTIEFEGEMFL
jgi:hypothetical protein